MNENRLWEDRIGTGREMRDLILYTWAANEIIVA
jgi:hypothetical protein